MGTPLLQVQNLPWPVNWADVFGCEAPMLLEVGFGSGHFLVDLAQKRPSANLLGIEISLPSIEKAQRKVKTAALTNVRLVQSNARYVLQALCEQESISEVYINFPDPWPKANHHHRRLISLDFFHLLATRMKSNGRIEIATDHADYVTVITEALEATPYFSSRLSSTCVTEDSSRLRTKYEQIALDEGRTCYYYKWARNEVSAPNKFPVPKELPMPHVVLHSPLNLDEIQARYGRWRVSAGECQISFMALFRASEGEALFVETYLNEPPLAQRVGLAIRQREPGNYVIGLHELGFPKATRGVHLAIGHLAKWLVGLDDVATILHHNLQGDVLAQEESYAA